MSSYEQVDNQPPGTAEHDPSAAVQLTQDSVEEISLTQGEDVQDKHHTDQLHEDPKGLPDNGGSTSGTQCEDSVRRNSFGFLDLSVHPAGIDSALNL